ncbi:Oidioi.mRNA.OKI2018_I69.PAR.g10869.t2.cds [Oikopleura dioica]|uniref:Oidioi.mRNA.OKI2018_I69.PAR.g10869.t2.cds n=1 Tax=Oikopleura dioica TaxID=34765 RepID=A0ABN7RSU9_OIKDI|nr:Oidioi.mRNA.OKI2018_I69.PAR.g10869.t2.cds [Oikopleura dioica]
MDSPSDLRALADGKKYSETIQAAMRVPSCISLQGFDSDDSPVHEKKPFEKIILRTPPTTLKLDDSSCWNLRNSKGPGDPAPSARQLVDKSMLQLKENLPMEGGIEPASDGDVFLSENSQVMDSSFFDQMSEVEKLRHQMFKVNRRITKLERLNSSLIEQKQIATYIAIAALSLSVFTLLVRRSP